MPYQDKPSSAPAIPFGKEGRSKNINDIISAIAVEGLLALKKDGNYENNFSIGDNTLNALVNQINIRQGSTIKEYDSTGANLLRTLTLSSATNLVQGFRYLDNPIKISNNPTNPLTEIDISAGVMNPDDGSDEVLLPTSMTRSTANDFANGGLLPNGTVLQTNTMYYVFAIYSTSSKLVSFYADTSRINPTLPTSPNNYDKKQYRGAFYVDGNGNIATGSYDYSNDFVEFNFSGTEKQILPNENFTTSFADTPSLPCPILSKALIAARLQGRPFETEIIIFIRDKNILSERRIITSRDQGNVDDINSNTFSIKLDSNSKFAFRGNVSDLGVQFYNYGWQENL